jgi:hypothetical protein
MIVLFAKEKDINIIPNSESNIVPYPHRTAFAGPVNPSDAGICFKNILIIIPAEAIAMSIDVS